MQYLSALKYIANQIFKAFATAAVVMLFLSANNIYAQLDPTFGTNGVTTTNVSLHDLPLAAFLLPDEKILVVNQGGTAADRSYFFVKYNSNGTLDNTYGTNGIIQLPIPFISSQTNFIYDAARQTDGKIVLVGSDNGNGIVLRFNENGTLDTGFAGSGIHRPNINQSAADYVMSVAIQSDGKIVVAGSTFVAGQGNRLYLLRYLSNGSLDEGNFGTEGYIIHNTFNADALNIFLQSTGKIITTPASAGEFSPGGTIRRFNTNGSVDGTFTTHGYGSYSLHAMTLQPDDKIITAERVTKTATLERTHTDALITRYNENGVSDTSFGTSGQTSFDMTSYLNDIPNALRVMPDGQILVSVSTTVYPNRSTFKGYTLALARLSASGAVNGKFLETTANYRLETNSFFTENAFLLVFSDGKISTVARFTPDVWPSYMPDLLLTRASGVPLQNYLFHGVPFDFNYTLVNSPTSFDGRSDPSVFRPSDRRWYFGISSYFFGLSDDVPVPSDYIGDFSTDLAMFRPSNGTWYIAKTYQNAATNYLSIQWGLNGDVPAPADYDGDGKSDLAVFRPSNGVWYIRNSADNSFTIFQWGVNGDKPVSGDYDGDGKYDVGVFRPSDGNWYILRSSDGQPYILHFGLNGDIPTHEDYDGDGKFDIAVFRPSEGVWYRLNSSDGSFYALQWGIPTDIPVPADYDGDLKADIAVWRETNGRWYVFRSTDSAMGIYNFGLMGDIPLAGRH